MEQGTGVEPFLVQIHPPLTFSDYFAPCICPKRCARFLVRKRKKPAPGLAMIAIPKPVFSDYTVFWAVFALKTRKLPDLPQTVRRGRVFAPKVHQRAALSFV